MLRAHLDHLIGQVLDFAPETSDIFVVAGKPLQAEVHGVLRDVPLAPAMGALTPFQTESMALCMMDKNNRLYRDLTRQGSCDLSYALPGRARFRVNIFSQRGSLSIVLRQLSMQVPSPARLGLPAVFEEMAREKFGLILVTGATGSGKSTSLAALVDSINEQFPVHILTLEDPVEYVHAHKRGTVNQRELGQDFDSFASGLRAALRQAPKVILVGEIRDRETMEIALQAGETGHLVLGTLHTADTGQTVNRAIGLFDPTEEVLIRQRLSEALKFVVSQRLPPRVGGGRVAAFEIMRNTLRIKELIQNGESGEKTFYNVVEQGDAYGMTTFDQCLAGLFRDGLVTEETAMIYASDRSNLMQRLDRIKTARGDQVSDITGLEIDLHYGS
jgi:twitching motility protein PilT